MRSTNTEEQETHYPQLFAHLLPFLRAQLRSVWHSLDSVLKLDPNCLRKFVQAGCRLRILTKMQLILYQFGLWCFENVGQIVTSLCVGECQSNESISVLMAANEPRNKL